MRGYKCEVIDVCDVLLSLYLYDIIIDDAAVWFGSWLLAISAVCFFMPNVHYLRR